MRHLLGWLAILTLITTSGCHFWRTGTCHIAGQCDCPTPYSYPYGYPPPNVPPPGTQDTPNGPPVPGMVPNPVPAQGGFGYPAAPHGGHLPTVPTSSDLPTNVTQNYPQGDGMLPAEGTQPVMMQSFRIAPTPVH